MSSDDNETVSAKGFAYTTEGLIQELEECHKAVARLQEARTARRKEQTRRAAMASRKKRVLGGGKK
jgi:septal ring factor EnvC (AmiA/AmiB activator)